ncbi:MAG: lysine-2,3-aminomutase-like protein [Hyphomicrobiaceae bacterium]|nr:lysine-2,3-aminomutase-like protein [Hyphomicrobiaceae bacterium]
MKRGNSTLRSIPALRAAGLARDADPGALAKVGTRYAIAITPEMVRLIDPSDAHDPIARQFVPDVRELQQSREERADPLNEEGLSPVPGIVHRYPDRVLLKLTHVCPVYCRFCFRREVVGPGGPQALSGGALDAAFGYITRERAIWEVILTGGDPFMLSPRRISEVSRRLGAIEHIVVLRWHTRVPVADPGRITDELVGALKAASKTVYVVLHCNHARELTDGARDACARLVDAGIPMLAQTVLLKGVNDDAEVLAQLMRAFVGLRLKPYYLHHLDAALGTSHFRTTIAEGQRLMRALRGRISGLAQPTYVLDIPGGHGKVPIGPDYLADDGQTVVDNGGAVHDYPERG